MTRTQFLINMDNASSHRLLMWYALQATKFQVLELGVGGGSTLLLREYAADNDRILESYESDLEQFKSYPAYHPNTRIHFNNGDWKHSPIDQKWSVALLDHSPNRRRRADLTRLANQAEIIVVHDTEPHNNSYGFDNSWGEFKYKIDSYHWTQKDAWTTAVSNVHDITGWNKFSSGDYVIAPFKR